MDRFASRDDPRQSYILRGDDWLSNAQLNSLHPIAGPPVRGSIIRGSIITCHHLSYEVSVKDQKKMFAKTTKTVITDVSGYFPQGMNAIIGPSGSGKTSLLDLLAGRKDPRGMTGQVLIDGKRQPDNFKCLAGYVSQDDVVMGSLTVRENLTFSANLRLRRHLSKEQKYDLVQETIDELGLSKCADTKVGTEFIRGVSGGERKRTNIGMELIISPGILFLDEPTTGLDASTANAVMSALRQLSLRGRTIIFSIHQPRYTIYNLIDRLLLLTSGRTIYHGQASQALDYFSYIGYTCEAYNNPPDFFLDVINGDSSAVRPVELGLSSAIATDGRTDSGNDAMIDVSTQTIYEPADGESLANQLAEKYTKSVWCRRNDEALAPIWKHFQLHESSMAVHIDEKKTGAQYATDFQTQLYYLSTRAVMSLLGNPFATALQFLVMVFFAVVIGFIYWDLDTNFPAGIQNRIGAFFFIIVTQMFGNMSSTETFIRERKLFIHENTSGFYRVSSYYLSKLACDTIPMRFLPLVLFSLITYFMMGLRMDEKHFFIYFFNMFVTTMACLSLCFLASASTDSFAIASLLVAAPYVTMSIFGGLMVNVATMPDWIRWLQYASIIRYSLNGFAINEMANQTYFVYTNNGTSIPLAGAGNRYLDTQGISHGTDWELWQNMMANALIAIGLICVTYVQLRRMRKLT